MSEKYKRIGISKKLRFQIFARDNFTCRYCGRQSDEVQLRVDHIIPVCQGGTNDEPNLITSCEPCNQGKGGKTISQSAPTESDRLRILQEYQEQIATARAALAANNAKKEFRQIICNKFCEAIGQDSMSTRTLNILTSYAEEFGADALFDWIDLACVRVTSIHGRELNVAKYVSGIRRHHKEEMDQCQ